MSVTYQKLWRQINTNPSNIWNEIEKVRCQIAKQVTDKTIINVQRYLSSVQLRVLVRNRIAGNLK